MCFESGLKTFYCDISLDTIRWLFVVQDFMQEKLEEKYNAPDDNVSPHFQYTEQKIIDGF